MKLLNLTKISLGLTFLSFPLITGVIFLYSLIFERYLNELFILTTVSDTRRWEYPWETSSMTLVFISACGFIGAYLLNSVKNK